MYNILTQLLNIKAYGKVQIVVDVTFGPNKTEPTTDAEYKKVWCQCTIRNIKRQINVTWCGATLSSVFFYAYGQSGAG